MNTATKRAKRFLYEGLGFPIELINVRLVKKRGVWTPAINYNKLDLAPSICFTGDIYRLKRCTEEMDDQKNPVHKEDSFFVKSLLGRAAYVHKIV